MSDHEEETFAISINTEFAKLYEKTKREEDITKIRDEFRGQEVDDERIEKIIERKRKYGIDKEYDDEEGITIKVDGEDHSDLSDDEIEDDNGELVTAEVDSQILKTLVLIKTKNEAIYDQSKNFFDEKALDSARQELLARKKEALKNKPVTLKTLQQEKYNQGKVDSDDSDEDNEPVLTHEEEQRLLKENLKNAIDSHVQKEEDSDEEFFMKRKKTEEEHDLEEEDYREFLLEEMAKVDTSKEIFDQWASYKSNPKVSQDDAFLMDYVLNRGWIDKNASKVPTYEEIVGEVEDEEQFEKAEEFEHEYNFRFEEPGGIDIVNYSRNQTGIVREKKSKRREARLRKRERERAKKVDEDEKLKRLKNEKMGEINETLNELRRITGDSTLSLQDIEATLEGEFDPTQFNANLNSKFNAESLDKDSDEKPVFDDDIDIGDIEALQSPEEAKQVQNAARKLLEDYYNIDYEDKIDDLKTRFKYRQVEPATGGLDVMDILLADDKDLNDVVSLKHIAPFNTDAPTIKPKYSKVVHLRRKLVDEGVLNPNDVEVGIPARPDHPVDKKRKRSKKSKPH